MRKLRSGLHGFSLVELAIVLVIAAVIIAGIFAGRNLLEKTATRTIVTDVNGVHEAIKQFQKTYNAVPGDMYDATTRLGPTATNGNGNGVLDAAEYPVVWQHLALAGLIPGQYNPAVAQPGVGLMAAKFGKEVGLEVVTEPTAGLLAIRVSRYDPASATMSHGFLPPTQARLVDEKFDDGNPDAGNIRAYTDGGVGGNCTSAGAYSVQETRQNCYLTFLSSEMMQGDASAFTMAAPVSDVTGCEAGQPIGSTKVLPCPDGLSGTYTVICREGGVWEQDPGTPYNCSFPDCSADTFNDNDGDPASFPATAVGATAAGNCTTSGKIGYTAGGVPNDASYPRLTCFAPGGTTGWRMTGASPQTMDGYCDWGLCSVAELQGRAWYVPQAARITITNPSAYAPTQAIYGETVTLGCIAGYSSPDDPNYQCTLIGSTVVFENKTYTCYLNCTTQNRVCTSEAGNCSFAAINHGLRQSAPCPTGYQQSGGINPSYLCTNGAWGDPQNMCVPADCPADPSGYLAGTQASATTGGNAHNTTLTVACAVGYQQNPAPNIRCRYGQWTTNTTQAAGAASPAYPVCQETSCPSANLADGGGTMVPFPTTNGGATANVNCAAALGSAYSGSISASCSLGNWSAVTGTCTLAPGACASQTITVNNGRTATFPAAANGVIVNGSCTSPYVPGVTQSGSNAHTEIPVRATCNAGTLNYTSGGCYPVCPAYPTPASLGATSPMNASGPWERNRSNIASANAFWNRHGFVIEYGCETRTCLLTGGYQNNTCSGPKSCWSCTAIRRYCGGGSLTCNNGSWTGAVVPCYYDAESVWGGCSPCGDDGFQNACSSTCHWSC